MYEEKPILWLLPRNSYEKHMTGPTIHCVHSYMMNPDEDHDEPR